MIPRTRPYIDISLASRYIDGNIQFERNDIDRVFLNSGQACLEIFLSALGPNKRVGIQVFTCPTVSEAIILSGDTPVYMDIDMDYFTTRLDVVQSVIDHIDILVLTHLFGIPNPDYVFIKSLCKEKNVILIDDLCQTYKAKVGGAYIEELSDNYFYSFFYDKPISCASGGMLKVCIELKDGVKSIISKLPQESDKEGRKKIRKLVSMHSLLSPDVYRHDFRTNSIFENWILAHYSHKWGIKWLYKLLSSPFNRFSAKLLPKYDYSNRKMRMSNIQVPFILHLFDSYQNRTNILKDYYHKNGYALPLYLINTEIECSCSQRAIIKKEDVRLDNAEVGLYNWPHLLDNTISYPNAEYVINNCVNIPIVEI